MSETRVRPELHGKELILAVLRWILIIFFAVYTLFPLVWLFISSLKTNYEFLALSPFALPSSPQWGNYLTAPVSLGGGAKITEHMTQSQPMEMPNHSSTVIGSGMSM